MSTIVNLGFLGMFVLLTRHYWHQLFGRETIRGFLEFRVWVAQGLGFPAFFWTVSNIGVFDVLPPLLPDLATARIGGFAWINYFCANVSPGVAFIGSVWSAATFVWLAAEICHHGENRKEFFITAALCSVLSGSLGWLFLYMGGLPSTGVATLVWLVPVVHCSVDLVPRKETRPMYSRAIAKLKFGKYSEAEWEVIHQLEQCEDDFEGWMLLADLYATQFQDVHSATQVISDLVEQSNLTSMQRSVAMHRLADWHLKRLEDPGSARTILEDLCRRCPGGHIEKMARQRIERMPLTQDDLRQQNAKDPIRLPALNDDLDGSSEPAPPSLTKAEAVERANRCAERLSENPNNAPVREDFARLLAEQLGKTDAAIEQIGLLMEMPDQEDKKKAEWLSLLASWQLRYKHDSTQAEILLKRLIQEFPESPQAFAAQRRMNLLDFEKRIAEARNKSVGRQHHDERGSNAQ